MKSLTLTVILLSFVSCNGSSGGGGLAVNPETPSNNATAIQESRAFIEESRQTIEPALQINNEDLRSWTEEDVATPEEFQTISENI